MRLIDADALQRTLRGLPRDSQQAELYHASVMAAVKTAPTVPAMVWHETAREGLPPRSMTHAGEYLTANKHSNGEFWYNHEMTTTPELWLQDIHYDRVTEEPFYGVQYWMEIVPPEVENE